MAATHTNKILSSLLASSPGVDHLFPTAECLHGTEDYDTRREDYTEPDAGFHPGSRDVVEAAKRFIGKDSKATLTEADLPQFRHIIKTGLTTAKLKAPTDVADALADILVRSVYHAVHVTSMKETIDSEKSHQQLHEKLDADFKNYYAAQQKQNPSIATWEVKTGVERIRDHVMSKAKVNNQSRNPVLACHDKDGFTVHVDRHFPETYKEEKSGRVVSLHEPLFVHELVEAALMETLQKLEKSENNTYGPSHQFCERVEAIVAAVLYKLKYNDDHFDYRKYDETMQENINRIDCENKNYAAMTLFRPTALKRDGQGNVTNLGELLTLHKIVQRDEKTQAVTNMNELIDRMERAIENILHISETQAELRERVRQYLVPDGANMDTYKPFADEIPENPPVKDRTRENIDMDVVIYAHIVASQRLYPRFQHHLNVEQGITTFAHDLAHELYVERMRARGPAP